MDSSGTTLATSDLDTCLICKESGWSLVSVRAKGIASLVHYSQLRENTEFTEYLQTHQGNVLTNNVFVYKNCRRDYTNALRIKAPNDTVTIF